MAHTFFSPARLSDGLLVLSAIFIIGDWALSKLLSWLSLRNWSKPLPPELVTLYDAESYERAKQYAQIKFKLGMVRSTLSMGLAVTLLWFGGFGALDLLVRRHSDSAVLQSELFFAILALAAFLVEVPFSAYDTFVIEQRFGFNKTSLRLFVVDTWKQILLGTLIGGAVIGSLCFLYESLGEKFWFFAWVLVTAISVTLSLLFCSVLLPIFNKLTPLGEGALRNAIEQYAQAVGFPLTNIYVMDGSKRSTKANAFFSGIFQKKDIVLYDNLLAELSAEEVTAVLAHEVGHYKRRHIMRSLALSVAQTGIMLYLFGLLSRSSVFAEMLGSDKASFHLGLVGFSLLYSPLSTLSELLMNWLSRKHEYEADAFARTTYGAAPLIEALKKMSRKHLSNLQPHAVDVFLRYSHPPLAARIGALQAPPANSSAQRSWHSEGA
ncbi:MAG: M48 family metallopeptidase [Bdellovibrionota bacterium]